jgi:putative membrane protein insertion efficiency factor
VRKLITSLNTKEINDSTIPKVQEMTTKFRHQLRSKSESDTVENDAGSEKQTKSQEGEAEIMSQSMIMAIGFYKQFISPLLPPACRFLPTCSQYGVQAIKEFGPSKGVILTAWRLARCSPFGGRGE